jgi:HEAT repeat protein/beta-lactamase regulating signal transducer with metallopeptidase domain
MSFSLADSSLVSTLTPWLPILDAVLKSTALLVLTAALSLVLRRASAATRHMLWTCGLLGALVLPLLSLALPKWRMPVVSVVASVPSSPASPAVDTPARIPTTDLPAAHRARPDSRLSQARGEESAAPTSPSLTSRIPSPGTMAIALWAAGALAILARLGMGLLAVQWMSRRTERVTDAPWLPLARELAEEISVSPALTFLRSPRATMPMAWGIWRPAVLMPADADTWPPERLRIVLLHELAHVKRRDCLTHALAQIACAVYWFNPLAWIAARHLRAERERACDDLVLAAGTRGSDYAAQLIEVARAMRSGRFPALLTGATLAMAHRSQLEGRLIAILDPRVPRSGVSRARTAAATGVVACALVPLASMQPWAYTEVPQAIERQPLPAPIATVVPSPAIQAAAPQPAPQPVPAPSPLERVAESAAQAALNAVANAASDPQFQTAVRNALTGVASAALQGVEGAIAENLSNTSQGERQKADPRMVAALTAALKDTDAEVRETAMHALVQLGDPSIFEPLVQALRDASADIREQAAVGLGQLRDARAIQPLTAALKDQSASVREQVVFALGQLKARDAAGAIGQALKDQNASVREQAAFALGQLRDPQAVDALSQALKDADASVREQAAFALGQIRDRRAVAALSAALADSSESVREQVVFALGQLRDPAAVDTLIAALRDERPGIREHAVFALGQIRDPRAVAPLVAALKDANAEVRHNAAFALGQLRDRGAVDGLIAALKDADAEVRGQAAFALGQLRDPRAIDALTGALKDSNSEVRQQAAFALGQLAR